MIRKMIKDYDKIYVQDFIIQYLERYTAFELEQVPWAEMEESLNLCVSKGISYMLTLHKMMLPYYEMYMFADTALFRTENPYARYFVEHVAEKDTDFGHWATGIDIVAATESWGDFLKLKGDTDARGYLRMLRVLVHSSYETDWKNLGEELKERLFQAEAISKYKTDELLCILHAVSMIMQTEWSKTKKIQVFDLMSEHWGYLKYVYSVMTRHIVGCRLKNFAQVTNAVMQSNDNKPYLHIYYCMLTDRINDFGLTEKQYRKLDDQRLRLRNEMDKNEPSDILYELCDTIFPEEFQRILDEHRPPSYNEIKDENKQKDKLIASLQRYQEQSLKHIKELTSLLVSAVEASIPVEDIENELMNLPAGVAWDVFKSLNELLQGHVIWRKYDVGIREKLMNRILQNENKKDSLYDAIKEVANKPTNEYISGDKNVMNKGSKQVRMTLPEQADLSQLLPFMNE